MVIAVAEIVNRRPAGAEIRIGTAEREKAAAVLGEHFSAGRLDTDEFDQRVREAYLARTAGDLAPLFTDLPAPTPSAIPRERRAPQIPPLRALALFALLIACIVWIAAVRVPPFFIFPLMWLFWGRRFGQRRYHGWTR
jgi:hypothetical protein